MPSPRGGNAAETEESVGGWYCLRVVTDGRDGAHLVGDTGRVVPPRDPEALARAWESLVRLEPAAGIRLGLAARARIAEHFALPRIAERYAALYRRSASRHGPA